MTPLNDHLKAFAAIRKEQVAIQWCLRLAVTGITSATMLCMIDNLCNFSQGARLTLLLLYAAGVLLWAIALHRRLKGVLPTRRLCALALERHGGIHDNILINAVCFSEDSTLSDDINHYFQSEAGNRAAAIAMPRLLEDTVCRRLLRIAGVTLVLPIAYAVCVPHCALNALRRFIHPLSDIHAINFAEFAVTPGDAVVTARSALTIHAKATRRGDTLTGLQLALDDGIQRQQLPMDNGRLTLPQVERPFEYRIIAGAESSRRYRVGLLPPPDYRTIIIEAAYPDYMHRPPQRIAAQASGGGYSFPEGTRLRFDWPGVRSSSGGQSLPWLCTLTKNQAIVLSATDKAGHLFHRAWEADFTAIPDTPPRISFQDMRETLSCGHGERLTIRMAAADDIGITAILLTAECAGQKIILRRFDYPAPGLKNLTELHRLLITPELLSPNTPLQLRATAIDCAGHQTTSKTITIHYRDLLRELKEKLAATNGARCYEKLFEAYERQLSLRDFCTKRLKNFQGKDQHHLMTNQSAVADGLAAAVSLAKDASLPPVFVNRLLRVSAHANGLCSQAVSSVKAFSPTALNDIILNQTSLIEELRQLLNLASLQENAVEERHQKEKVIAEEKALYDEIEKIKEGLTSFRSAQKKILTDTEAVDPRKTDDWSESEEKLLGDLSIKENEWAEIMKRLFSDFSKLQNQDFSNSAMADEFVEIYEELQRASAALQSKKMEIAVLAEANAFDFVENTITNLERWLSDTKDLIKWQAEEDGKSQDTDLRDLPAELQDIIGELIESEEDMDEDTQDGTNSSVWDSDIGLGWGVSDGTIDSMQAKGITGNILPNNNEVGGRSGEGRTGRSSGQFVEKNATGKGGRKTPTRLQNSPFEKGTVHDTSKDPAGGATGGGKQSGIGEEGLQGITPDQDQRTGVRLWNRQTELQQRTQAALKRIEERLLPTADLRDALKRLEALQQLKDGGGVEGRTLRRQAVQSLRRAVDATTDAMHSAQEHTREQSRSYLPIRQHIEEKIPPQHAEEVGDYFKSLAATPEE